MGGLLDPADSVPTEDTIEALLEYLVAPLLPIRNFESHQPTDRQHETVAKQMHAVVMLYNYYHRRSFPKLQFLGLESICKLSCIAKPCLFAYLRHTHGFKEDPGNLNQQLSLTERMVIDACNICIGLDSSKDTPNIETWPISKVAVFLVDSTHEKCMLQFSSVTQGVWSLVEKVLLADNEKMGKGLQLNTLAFHKVTSNGSSHGESYQSEKVLEQLAFSTVQQLTGISHSDLRILEHHLTYSLSHEKTATLLYIMTYGRAVSEELSEFAIKDVLNSLEGPIVKRTLTSEVEITSVVEYYDVLPYAEIMSNWVSRTCSPCPEPNSLTIMEDRAMNDDLLNDQVEDNLRVEKGKLTTDACDVNHIGTVGDASSPKIFALEPLLVPASMPAIDYPHTTKRSGLNEQLNMNSNKMIETEKPISNTNNDLSSMNVPSCGVSSSLNGADIVHTEEHAKNDKSVLSAQTEDIIIGKNTKVGDSFTNGLSVNSCEDDNPSLSYHQLLTQTEDISGKNVPDSYIIRGNNNIPFFDGSGNKAGMVDLPKKACVLKCTVQSITGVSNAIPDGIASDDVPLVPTQSSLNDHSTFYHVMKSRENDLMKACLRVLQKKRDELCQQQRLLEDEIARCEMNIQAILTEGDKSTRKVESILGALYSLCSGVQVGKNLPSQEHGLFQTTKRRKLSDALLCSKDACQELDEVCHMNSWILPRYCVLPSFADCQINGKFEARVTVEGTDFGCSSGGDPKSNPQQARESAASHLLMKLRRIGGGEQQSL